METTSETIGELIARSRLLLTAPVLHKGWEMDNEAWVYEVTSGPDAGRKFLVMSSHGGRYEADLQELRDKLDEYRVAIRQTEKALAFLA